VRAYEGSTRWKKYRQNVWKFPRSMARLAKKKKLKGQSPRKKIVCMLPRSMTRLAKILKSQG
jgi:hypothetical protein